MMKSFNIWLPSWVILDGNYRNFRAGQEADFALLFGLLSCTEAGGRVPHLRPTKTSRYAFCGQTIFRGEQCQVIDVGVLGYHDYPIPPQMAEGTWWTGELMISIDPFFYFEELHRLPGVPPLIYPWRVERIRVDRTPHISERDAEGGLTLRRDQERESFDELHATDAWNPAYRDLDYLLTCVRLGEPSRTRRASLPACGQVALRDLTGAEVEIRVGGSGAILATILQVGYQQPVAGQALLRLQRPLLYSGKPYEYALAFPRYEGEEIDQLTRAGVFHCSVKGLEANVATSSQPFVLRQWYPALPLAAELVKL